MARFQRTARFRGPDLDSAVPAELVGVAGRLNNALRRLGSGWAIFVEAQRQPPAPIRKAISRMWRRPWSTPSASAEFEEAGAHFESSYFLTFLYLPPAEDAARAEAVALRGPRSTGKTRTPTKCCVASSTAPTACLQLVEGFMPECDWLDDEETLTYLHSTISTKRHRVRVPEIPDVSRCAAGRPAADRRARADARQCASAHADGRRLSDRRPRPGFSTSSTGWPFPIAGRRGRSCSTRPMQRGC